MLTPYFHKQFKKDIKHCQKEGRDMDKIKAVLSKLISEEKLESKYRLHKLSGEYKDRLECHVAPDWLLIFKIEGDMIIFERTGSHGKLFK